MAKRKVTSNKAELRDVEVEEVELMEAGNAPFWEHPNFMFYLIGGALLLIALYFGYREFISKPKQVEAEAAIWQAQIQFERDSFNLALNDPGGGYDGFLSIIDKFGGTPTGNTAQLYAGLSYLHLGDFDNAIKYLEDYDPSDEVFSASKYMALGDAYSEKEDFSAAIGHYETASEAGDNEMMNAIALKKLGMLQLKQGNKEDALEAFLEIRENYPTSPVASDVERYIAQAGGE